MSVTLHPAGAATIRSEEQAYDDFPYESNAFGQSQPARIAAVAHLFGLNPPPVETARVLELGCAAGGNLIPLALHFPEARFVGVDISSRQITDGVCRASRLGLKNIELRHTGIESLTADDGKFDYIICHGIYSWVPEPVRDALLRVCAENLSDDGVAFVSYNTLPGWHFVQPVREMMQYWTQDITDPTEKLRAALALLDGLKDIAVEPAGSVYRQEADMLKAAKASYVLHDHLEVVNAPCYLKDFVAHAELHALSYLSDAAFIVPNLLNVNPAMAGLADKYSSGDIVRAEQLLDFMRHRRFRETLLVKQVQQPRIDRSSPLARLEGLHFRLVEKLLKDPAQPAHMQAMWWDAKAEVYRLGVSVINVRSQAASRALAWLATRVTGAATFTLQDLVAAAASTQAQADEDKQHLAGLLWELMGTPAFRTYSCSITAPTAGELPAATALALADAALGSPSTSNVFHDHIRLTETQRKLLLLLGGICTPSQPTQMTQLMQGMEPGFSEEQIAAELRILAENHLLC